MRNTGRTFLATTLAIVLLFAAGDAVAGTYEIWDDWGGTWADAEKTSDNSEDDLLCWAASASNVLEWTGWGQVGGMTTTDDMFGYFQDHWTDVGGNPYYAWDWWFDGTNDSPNTSSWAQVDVSGGGFWSGEDISDYRYYSTDDSAAMATIDSWLHSGYGTTISIGGAGAHSITVWGFETDSAGDYAGLYVTDSDDDEGGTGTRPDKLRYYDVAYSNSRWYLDDYAGSDGWYITEVVALDHNPAAVPLPGSAFMGMGLLLGLALIRRRRRSSR